MKRVFLFAVSVLIIGLILPPLWYSVFPADVPGLPASGRRVPLGDGVFVNVLDEGSGAPIVLVHGLPGSAYDWRPTQEALVDRGYRVLAYDRVGYGYSDSNPDGVYTVESSAQDLLALLENAGLSDVTLVGWSYGGAASMRAALQDSSRIGRLVLVGSAGYLEAPPTPPPGAEWVMNGILSWVAYVPPAEFWLQGVFSQHAFSPSPLPDWWLPQLAANFRQPGTEVAWLGEQATISWDGPDPRPIPLPILVAHGDKDALVPLEVGEWLHERSMDSRLWVIEGAGHMLPVTHPEALADQIQAFIQSEPG